MNKPEPSESTVMLTTSPKAEQRPEPKTNRGNTYHPTGDPLPVRPRAVPTYPSPSVVIPINVPKPNQPTAPNPDNRDDGGAGEEEDEPEDDMGIRRVGDGLITDATFLREEGIYGIFHCDKCFKEFSITKDMLSKAAKMNITCENCQSQYKFKKEMFEENVPGKLAKNGYAVEDADDIDEDTFVG